MQCPAYKRNTLITQPKVHNKDNLVTNVKVISQVFVIWLIIWFIHFFTWTDIYLLLKIAIVVNLIIKF